MILNIHYFEIRRHLKHLEQLWGFLHGLKSQDSRIRGPTKFEVSNKTEQARKEKEKLRYVLINWVVELEFMTRKASYTSVVCLQRWIMKSSRNTMAPTWTLASFDSLFCGPLEHHRLLDLSN